MDTGDRPHYQGKIECIDAIEQVIGDMGGPEAFLTAQCLKYLWRWNRKGKPTEDLIKCRWYLNRLISKLEATDGQKEVQRRPADQPPRAP